MQSCLVLELFCILKIAIILEVQPVFHYRKVAFVIASSFSPLLCCFMSQIVAADSTFCLMLQVKENVYTQLTPADLKAATETLNKALDARRARCLFFFVCV